MSAVKTYRDFLDINQAAQFLQEKGLASCSPETIKYHAYETGLLPLPIVLARRSYWSKKDLDLFVLKLAERPRDEIGRAVKRKEAERKHERAQRLFEHADAELQELDRKCS